MEHAMKVFMIGFRVKYVASQIQDLWTVDVTATQLCVTLVRSLSRADLRLLAFKTWDLVKCRAVLASTSILL